MKRKTPLPVTVLTGFLGAGKTTILRHLAESGELKRTLVLINEFGELGLDHHLLGYLDDDSVVLMDSGCICCSIRHDLVQTLSQAAWRYSSGGERWFDRVVIETTGLADPAPVLQTLLGEPRVTKHYALDRVLTVVDATYADRTLRDHAEARRQVSVADHLLLTKTDRCQDDTLQPLRDMLKNLSSVTPLVVNRGVVDPGLFSDGGGDLLSAGIWQCDATVANRLGVDEVAAHEPGASTVSHQGTGAVTLLIDDPVDAALMDECLAGLLREHGEELLRIKGLVHTEHFEMPLVVQAVRHVAYVSNPLKAWPEDVEQCTQLVVIARKEWLSRSVLQDWFAGYDFAIRMTAS